MTIVYLLSVIAVASALLYKFVPKAKADVSKAEAAVKAEIAKFDAEAAKLKKKL